MKPTNIRKLVFLGLVIISLKGLSQNENQSIQSYQDHKPTTHHLVALEVIKASKDWINAFNKGDVETCLAGYDQKALMKVTPMGIKNGIEEISDFWISFVESGANNLVYTDVSVEVINETTVFLSAHWSMNVGSGIIFQEKWEKKFDKWVLTYDDFQVLNQFETPRFSSMNPTESHRVLEEVINTSINWIHGFNDGNAMVCGNGYSIDAVMNAYPFGVFQGKEVISGFWSNLIQEGAKNITYHNPTFKTTTKQSAFISSLWSMNIGEGKIYQEKWENINSQWVLTYDEFEVLKQY